MRVSYIVSCSCRGSFSGSGIGSCVYSDRDSCIDSWSCSLSGSVSGSCRLMFVIIVRVCVLCVVVVCVLVIV